MVTWPISACALRVDCVLQVQSSIQTCFCLNLHAGRAAKVRLPSGLDHRSEAGTRYGSGRSSQACAQRGKTVYLLPSEYKRVRRLALELDVASMHELLLLGLDRLLAEQGEPPLVRYSLPRPKKG